MAETFKWCFVGTGTLANIVAKEILKSGRHEIVSVYTRRIEKAKEFTAQYGGTPFDNIDEAINAPGVQGVYVVTPHNAHYQYVKRAIELGKPVLCEKSFTTDAGQAKELFRLAEEKQVYVTEAMWTWFSPVANQVKKWLDDGEFGEIKELRANYHMDVRKYAPRLTDPKLAGGALLDSGVYPVTYLYRLFGKPETVSCEGVLENGVDMEENILFTFANGFQCCASVSIRDFKGLEQIRIVGSKAKLRLFWFHSTNKAKLRRVRGKNISVSGSTSYTNEFDLVADEIRAGLTESRFVPHRATADVMEIMDECRRQMGLVYPFEAEKAQ